MKWIIIDEGDTFEGTVEQFQDCFFSNADNDSIMEWADNMNSSCIIIDDTEDNMKEFVTKVRSLDFNI